MARRMEEQPRRRRRKQKKKKGRKFFAFLSVVLTAVIIVLGALVLFQLQKITVKGNTYTSEKEIAQMVQSDPYSENALYVFGKYFLGKGETLPCLETVDVSFITPWNLKVTVKEKTPAGYVESGDTFLFFDKEGLVVCKGTEKMADVPLVEGLDVERTELYHKLGGDGAIYETIYEVSSALKKYGLAVDKLYCEDGKVSLYIGDVCVSLGSSVTPEKIAQVPPIMDKLGERSGTLHLENYIDGAETVTFEAEKK